MDFTPHTEAEIAEMLRVIGVSSIEELFAVIPSEFKVKGCMNLPESMSEADVLARMKELAALNMTADQCPSFLGGGAYNHYVPAAIHHLVGRGEFLTSYTPYQPELSQGTLQAQFEYQSMVAQILGMDVSNASMYEGATAMTEACLMAQKHTRRDILAVSSLVHPQYIDVLRTYTGAGEIVMIPAAPDGTTDMDAARRLVGDNVAAVVVQTPNFLGVIEDVRGFSDMIHDAGGLSIVTFTEALAFGLIDAPGNRGADICAGEGQSLGIPLSFGGPYIGMMGVKQEFVKSMPGRLIGKTKDHEGRDCFVLTLAAREQHIRRERASSNICSNEALCAVALTIYMSMLGRNGYPRLAMLNHLKAERLKGMLREAGFELPFAGPTFNEFVVRIGGDATRKIRELAEQGMMAGIALGSYFPHLSDCILVAVTEKTRDADMDALIAAL
ncbi:MAG TPA: aminomethyl-transferring glycine dehydrogenase subunit GcvPA [Myxococcota bacterium]|nr:aminomethyl-transferring glycine dehydrogenase subunit GcvPA [Myxococcota bacterium]HOH76154.1 aminomethyl-transferring glycine dehydrogenase subunit GcvPA [Myxococcota bacterium]HPV03612.1 aminomethyl-transferring glycine dehydrogenase subunit GcvPA [Myxococcota bacterium]